MRTTLTIDDCIVRDLVKQTGAKNLVEAVRTAIRDYLIQRKKNRLFDLFGKIDLDVDINEFRNREVQKHDRR